MFLPHHVVPSSVNSGGTAWLVLLQSLKPYISNLNTLDLLAPLVLVGVRQIRIDLDAEITVENSPHM